jgi:hypothetical protein
VGDMDGHPGIAPCPHPNPLPSRERADPPYWGKCSRFERRFPQLARLMGVAHIPSFGHIPCCPRSDHLDAWFRRVDGQRAGWLRISPMPPCAPAKCTTLTRRGDILTKNCLERAENRRCQETENWTIPQSPLLPGTPRRAPTHGKVAAGFGCNSRNRYRNGSADESMGENPASLKLRVAMQLRWGLFNRPRAHCHVRALPESSRSQVAGTFSAASRHHSPWSRALPSSPPEFCRWIASFC